MRQNLLAQYDKLSPEQQVLFGRMILAFATQQDLMRDKLPNLFPGTPLSEHCIALMNGASGNALGFLGFHELAPTASEAV